MPDSGVVGEVRQHASEGHLAVRLHANRASDVPFLFERSQKRFSEAFGVSLGIHIILIVLAIVIAARPMTRASQASILPESFNSEIVWLTATGPGGGGGGGGNETPEPPRKAELEGKDKVTVPVIEPPKLENPDPKDEPPVEQLLNIPAKTLAASDLIMPGAIVGALESPSLGSGVGGGAGTGSGSGIGSGEGSGLGPGWGGGTGGGAYRPGNGVELPRVIREVKPQYTADAMRAKVQGTVLLECVVRTDGTVGDVSIVRSLDPTFGLDREAVTAAKQWRFQAGTRFGQPVAVLVTIELTFTLR